jgi:UDP-2,3-diacylglucosamine pyrophosphatase LpxH
VHLGTFGSHAVEFNEYLSSIKPKNLVLNGYIVNICQISNSYFIITHFKIIQKIRSLSSQGTEIYYITRNRDEMLRKLSDQNLSNIELIDKLLLEMEDKKAWIFHGDVLDASANHSKGIIKLGCLGYDYLILFNRLVNLVFKKNRKKTLFFFKEDRSRSKKSSQAHFRF